MWEEVESATPGRGSLGDAARYYSSEYLRDAARRLAMALA
jgi:hypothetical protein